ncbi:hypothetical protein BH23PSE1_BH23PSE1_17900 [soil metagenome]
MLTLQGPARAHLGEAVERRLAALAQKLDATASVVLDRA